MKESYGLSPYYDDVDSLLQAITADASQIKFLFLISKENLFDTIKEWIPFKYGIRYIEEKTSISTIEITREIKGNKKAEKRHISGVFYLVKIDNSDIYVAITTEDQKFMNFVLKAFFDRYYSEASRLYLTSKQIKQILDSLKNFFKCEIITDRVVSYSRINKQKVVTESKKPRYKESDLRWTQEEYTRSFERAAENDLWIDKISFYGYKDDKLVLNASLSREGIFKCMPRNIEEFYKIASKYLLNIGAKNVKLFSNKSITENKGKIKPLMVEYVTNIFEDVDQNKRLIRALSEFPDSSYSVYHGNPYLHASIVDYSDGSSYDIWVLSDNTITIIPQLRATFNSISRLCEHILKKFEEGEIVELDFRKNE
jgi:hypothetical protein